MLHPPPLQQKLPGLVGIAVSGNPTILRILRAAYSPSIAPRTKRCRLLAAESSRCPTICLRVHFPGLQGVSARSGDTASSHSWSASIPARKLRAVCVGITMAIIAGKRKRSQRAGGTLYLTLYSVSAQRGGTSVPPSVQNCWWLSGGSTLTGPESLRSASNVPARLEVVRLDCAAVVMSWDRSTATTHLPRKLSSESGAILRGQCECRRCLAGCGHCRIRCRTGELSESNSESTHSTAPANCERQTSFTRTSWIVRGTVADRGKA